MILARCFSTVRVPRSKSEAISLEDRPRATGRATSISRGDNTAGDASLASGKFEAFGPDSAWTLAAKTCRPPLPYRWPAKHRPTAPSYRRNPPPRDSSIVTATSGRHGPSRPTPWSSQTAPAVASPPPYHANRAGLNPPITSPAGPPNTPPSRIDHPHSHAHRASLSAFGGCAATSAETRFRPQSVRRVARRPPEDHESGTYGKGINT